MDRIKEIKRIMQGTQENFDRANEIIESCIKTSDFRHEKEWLIEFIEEYQRVFLEKRCLEIELNLFENAVANFDRRMKSEGH